MLRMNLPFVSIIVLNYNGKEHLKDCFDSLKEIDYPKNKYEIIMVDNNSSDDSINYTKKNFPFVRISKLDKNYGFAEGNNKGAEIAKGEYLVFLNNDTKVDKNWLIELINPLLTDKNIKISGSKQLVYDEPDKIRTLGGYLTLTGGGTREIKLPPSQNYVGYVSGSSLLIEKSLFIDLNGFDESYFMYSEEVDLCWRSWLLGYKTVLAEKSIIWHVDFDNVGKRDKFLYYVIRNQLINVIKNFELYNLFKGLFIHFLYSNFQIVKYLILRKPKNIKSVFKSYFYVIANIDLILKKRKFIQKNRKLSDKKLYKLNLIQPLFGGLIKEFILFKNECKR